MLRGERADEKPVFLFFFSPYVVVYIKVLLATTTAILRKFKILHFVVALLFSFTNNPALGI